MYDDDQEYCETAQPQQMDPRLQALIDREEWQQAEAAYESEMSRVVEQHPGLDPEDLHPFVVTADGDFDQAVQLRNAYVNRWNGVNAPAHEEASKPAARTIAEAVDLLVGR
jgi:hypothetical protein